MEAPNSFTLMTKPPIDSFRTLHVRERVSAEARSIAGSLREALNTRSIPRTNWGGHPAVTEYLIHGLLQLEVDFKFNPLTISSRRGDPIGVLGGKKAVQWAIHHVANQKSPGMVIGPNAFVTPIELKDHTLLSRISALIVPSQWVKDFYRKELKNLDIPIEIWASGVNESYWSPSAESAVNRVGTKRTALLYIKNYNSKLIRETVTTCESSGFQVQTISYGKYSRREYLTKLRESSVVIALGSSESQGLAMFEAWSVNVPTLVHSGNSNLVTGGSSNLVDYFRSPATSSPYLNPQTGNFWNSELQLAEILSTLSDRAMNPRNWILEHSSAAIAASKYLKVLTRYSKSD